MEYREIIQKVVQALGKPDYLEIGVNEGKSFRPVEAERKIGIDPDFRFDYVNRAKPNEKYYQMTSDEYFASHHDVIDGVAFIDGLHTCAQVMRDVDNVLKTMTPDSVILIDDSSPIFES